MLEVRGLARAFVPGAPLFEGLDLEVGAGELVAIVGESGSGKSTLLNVIAGLDRPDAGGVRLGGEAVAFDDDERLARWRRRNVGFVFQAFHLLPHLDVIDNVLAPALFAAHEPGLRARAVELLERLGLGARAEARPGVLSGGERQRVALARALARGPRVLLLDEPLSALDARTRSAATRELAEVLRETEAPTLLVTHDFADATRLADRVAVITEGRLRQLGTPAELRAAPADELVAELTGSGDDDQGP